jgi:asparagine synthase (glutamine-hydrolysing)
MCGIAGILSPGHKAKYLRELALVMQKSLSHRGPDDAGLFVKDEIALAHTRLSIIDLKSGRQPLFNEDKTICVIANGEIYNYLNIRETLLSYGHRFRTDSDCEVIIHLYEQYGKKCVEYLEGMFAFALWDSNTKTLMLARDRFGIKPLYLAHTKRGICFASELTAIANTELVEKKIDPMAVYAYITLSYIPAPLSIFKTIEKVKPSERIIFRDNKLERDIYWQPMTVQTPLKRSEALSELAWRFEKSVRSHLISDVPVAAFLSGGVDSSAVVSMARKHSDIETFCMSFPDNAIDESTIAKRVSVHLNTKHHQIDIPLEPEQLLQDAITYMDEPFADSSALPTFAVCRAARLAAKVVLSGDGGDEVFGGYTGRYRVAALKAAVPKPEALAKLIRTIPPWRNGKRISTPQMLELASLPETKRYIMERQITTPTLRSMLVGEDAYNRHEALLCNIVEKHWSKTKFCDPVHRALWMDLSTSLPDDMLTKVDRMSMAHGLEVRVPFLNHSLVEFTLSLKPNWLVSPFPVEGKRILRDLVKPMLPKGILNRPKQGFVVPLNKWLDLSYQRLLKEKFQSTSANIFNIMNRSIIRKLIKQPIGTKSREDLYALLVLEMWIEQNT